MFAKALMDSAIISEAKKVKIKTIKYKSFFGMIETNVLYADCDGVRVDLDAPTSFHPRILEALAKQRIKDAK